MLKWSLLGTVLFVVIEFATGVQAGSLALISDAGHNLTDALALLLALFGVWLQGKPADDRRTFGYHRGGVLAAFVNALVLLVLSVYLLYESYERLMAPQPVQESTMIIVAGLGLLLNAAVLWGLKKTGEDDLNIRAAAVHMLGDALGSIAIIIGAIIIVKTGWLVIDPILSILISCLIIWSSIDITKDSLNILLESLPKGLTLQAVEKSMQEIPGVLDVHDLHIWSLGSQAHALSCHALIEDMPPSQSNEILQSLNQLLTKQFKISHTTIQFEHVNCEVDCCMKK